MGNGMTIEFNLILLSFDLSIPNLQNKKQHTLHGKDGKCQGRHFSAPAATGHEITHVPSSTEVTDSVAIAGAGVSRATIRRYGGWVAHRLDPTIFFQGDTSSAHVAFLCHSHDGIIISCCFGVYNDRAFLTQVFPSSVHPLDRLVSLCRISIQFDASVGCGNGRDNHWAE